MKILVLWLIAGVWAHSNFDLTQTANVHCHPGEQVMLTVPTYVGGGRWQLVLPATDWLQVIGDTVLTGGIQEFTLECASGAPINEEAILELMRNSVEPLSNTSLAIALIVEAN